MDPTQNDNLADDRTPGKTIPLVTFWQEIKLNQFFVMFLMQFLNIFLFLQRRGQIGVLGLASPSSKSLGASGGQRLPEENSWRRLKMWNRLLHPPHAGAEVAEASSPPQTLPPPKELFVQTGLL